MDNLILTIDGIDTAAVDVIEPLPRAVLISLFSWRRADPSDDLPNGQRCGWWGDTYPQVTADRIGSRLWLLSRTKLTSDTALRAKEYAEQALQWLIDDGVAEAVTVSAERQGLDRLALGITITRGDTSALNLRFTNVWDYLHGI